MEKIVITNPQNYKKNLLFLSDKTFLISYLLLKGECTHQEKNVAQKSCENE